VKLAAVVNLTDLKFMIRIIRIVKKVIIPMNMIMCLLMNISMNTIILTKK